MWETSDEYKASMKSPVREQSFLNVTLSLWNEKANSSSKVSECYALSEYSYSASNVFRKNDYFSSSKTSHDIASYENGFTKVDGSMYFAPDNIMQPDPLQTSLISKYVGNSFSLTITIPDSVGKIKGFTIEFSENNYPLEIDVKTSTNSYYLKNDSSTFMYNKIISPGTITLTFLKMKVNGGRIRIRYISLGMLIKFSNDDILNASLTDYANPTMKELPQIDFSVSINNYDNRFSYQKSSTNIIYFIPHTNKIVVEYGYYIPDTLEIEWVSRYELQYDSLSLNETSLQIKAVDCLRNLTDTYYPNSTSLRVNERISEISETTGDISVSSENSNDLNNPFPVLSQKEAIQLLANFIQGELDVKTFKIKLKNMNSTAEDYSISLNDIMSYINVIDNDYKKISVNYHNWYEPLNSKGVVEIKYTNELFNQTYNITNDNINDEIICKLSEPVVEYKIQIQYYSDLSMVETHETTENEIGTYIIKVTPAKTGKCKIVITGSDYKKLTKTLSETHNGKEILTWDNPLIDESASSNELELMNSYSRYREYEFDCRGFPEIESGDVINLEVKDNVFKTVKVISNTINFNQSISGHMKVRGDYTNGIS